jgi:hypothetical protein
MNQMTYTVNTTSIYTTTNTNIITAVISIAMINLSNQSISRHKNKHHPWSGSAGSFLDSVPKI